MVTKKKDPVPKEVREAWDNEDNDNATTKKQEVKQNDNTK